MARKASVRYWASREGFCCWHQGKQHLLAAGPDDFPDGPVYKAAMKAFLRLTFGEQDALTVKEMTDRYVEWQASRRKPSTVLSNKKRFAHLCKEFGDKPAIALSNYSLECWVDRMRQERGWSDSTIHSALASVLACLRWAASRSLIKDNPIKSLEMPRLASRGLEVVLSPEQAVKVYQVAKGSTRDLIAFLRDTGCRPGEAAMAEAKHYDPQLRAIVIPAQGREGEATHKTARTGKPRVIYLRGEAEKLVLKLLRRHRKGPLLRSSRPHRVGDAKGQCWAWTSEAIKEALGRLRKKTGIKRLMAYSFRHTFAVVALRSGVRIERLAEIMGTSVQMIIKHYGHLADQTDLLRREVDKLDDAVEGG